MRLAHLDLHVRDVPASVAFFCSTFGLSLLSRPGPAKPVAVLGDGHGFVLVLQRAAPGQDAYPEGFHLGFFVETPEEVVALQEHARGEGLPVSDVIVNGRGTLAYVTAPEGYFVEVSCPKARP